MVAQKVEQDPASDPSKTHLRLWIRLLRTSRAIEADVRERLRLEFEVTLPRFDLMAALYRHPDGMKMSSLSKFLMVSNGNVTGIVNRMVKDGLVIRSQPDGDRRSWIIKLTKTGTQFFEKMAARHQVWIDEILQDVPLKDAEMVQTILANIKTSRQIRDE